MDRGGRVRRGSGLLLAAALATGGCATEAATATPPPATRAPTPAATEAPPASPSPTVAPSPSPGPTPTPIPDPAVAPLDGLTVDTTVARRLPLAVMVDDNLAARPQSGFNAASIVYQAPADGGETRYMLVFQEGDAELVGPVRSGRPYFIRWAAEYRAAFGHFGGDEKTRFIVIPALVEQGLIYDVDALAGAGAAYWRVRERRPPHNAYTSTERFRRVAQNRGAPASMVDGLATRPFADELPEDQRGKGGTITVPYNRGAAGYTYEPRTNAYLRSVAGRAHVDALDGKRVVAKNVVVLYMNLSIDPESEPGYRRPVLDQIGSGRAVVFRDGLVFEGTWRKRNEGDLTRFYDKDGKEVTLVPGRIFIQVVPTGTNVTWTAR